MEPLTPEELEILKAALHHTMRAHIDDIRNNIGVSTIEEDYEINGWDLIRLCVKLGVEYEPFNYGLGPIPDKT